MKELSIKEKVKAYDEALKRAVVAHKDEDRHLKAALERISPELKESEDERIRKWIKKELENKYVEDGIVNNVLADKAFAWLEKQKHLYETTKDRFYLEGFEEGQLYERQKIQRPTECNEENERIMKTLIHIVKGACNKYGIKYKGIEISEEKLLAWLEKQDKQNPCESCEEARLNCQNFPCERKKNFDSANKVEPKFNFKVGQWIVTTGKCVYLIAKIDGFNVTLVDTNGNEYVFDASSLDDAHEWNIADAKNGDVLACKGNIKDSNGIKYERICLFNNLGNAFFTLTKTSNHIEEYDIDVNIDYPDNTVPATKEQKELLFMAMAGAGYTFDFKKKELKKIVQTPVEWHREDEQNLNACLGYIPDEFLRRWLMDAIHTKYDKPAEWSEEDEKMRNNLIRLLIRLSACTHTNSTSPSYSYPCEIDWLKSLRSQQQWKPTEAQLVSLTIACGRNDRIGFELRQLLKELKEL